MENSEFIQGAYVDSNGYRSDGTYANMRTHNKLLPLSNYIVHLSSYLENMFVSIGLFSDGNGTWLRLYPTLVPITNGEYIIDTEDILTYFPGATHIRVNILSYADNTYYDISDVKINVYNQQGQTIIDQVEDLSESLNDYGENLDSQNVRLQKLESNKFILPLFNRGYKSINIIGDSISQGAVASSIPNKSYCGILRKMFSAELGGRLNYGFSAFDKSTDLGFDSSTVTWVYGSQMYGWQRNFADSSVLGGDSYTSTATNSRFCFKLWKNSHYLQIAIVGGSDKGCFELQNENGNVIAEIDCSTYPQGACLTNKIDISEIDASNGYEFLIVTKSADTVIISGVALSDNADYWTFNNYGRAGASPSVFTGDIFYKESRCSVLVYALGVNSGIDNLNNALASIKNTAKSLNAQKIVLCLCFKGNGFDNRSGGKPQALKAFSDDIGALFIDVYEHCPKDSNGYIVDGILSSDNIHPTDEGHRFIAELIAKNIGLSCNSGDDSTCNSELIDIRTGYDGTVYDSAGNAVRGQVKKINDYLDKRFTPYYAGGNIFNKDAAVFDDRYYNDDGTMRSYTGYGYSEYIPVEANTKYLFSHPFFINYFDSNKTYISGSHSSYRGTNMTTPNDCAYIIVSIEYQYKDQFMICKSSLPSEYVPFKYILDKVNNVDEITPLRNTVNGLEQRLSSVEGKMLSAGLNIYCIGDSLTRGVDQGTHVIDKGYPYWLEALLEATAVNCGYPGATSQTWWNSYKSLYPEPNDNTDIVLIMFGTNGGLDPDTISTDVEQYNNYADYADSGVGNMCKIIEWVMEKTHNNAQIILMTPPVNWTEGAEYRYTRVLNTVPVVKKIASRYSLPVIDVFNESGMNRFNGSAFRPIDGVHFNAHGYQKLGTYIASKIKGLYSTFEEE